MNRSSEACQISERRPSIFPDLDTFGALVLSQLLRNQDGITIASPPLDRHMFRVYCAIEDLKSKGWPITRTFTDIDRLEICLNFSKISATTKELINIFLKEQNS